MTEDRPDILVIPPLALLVALAAAFALEWFAPIGILPPFPWTPGLLIGLPFLIVSVVLNFAGARAFLTAGTPINPYKTSKMVVRRGAYRYTRNPMYLGMVGFLAALAPVFSMDWALIAAAILWAVIHWGVVLREETYLTRKFGAEYRTYLTETRRWL